MRTLAALLLMLSAFSRAHACDLEQLRAKQDLWAQPACLRGVSLWQKLVDSKDDRSSIGTEPVGPPYSEVGLRQLSEWGANLVDLSHPGLFTETAPYRINQKVAKNLDTLVTMAERANFFVVISFRTGPGRTEKAFSPEPLAEDHPVWTDSKAQQAWVEMWKATARRYKGKPGIVGYDLMVEPNSNGPQLKIFEADIFLSQYGKTLYNWYPLAQRIAKAIREIDADTPILIGGMDWSSVAWLPTIPKIQVPNVVYLAHHYEPFGYTHQKAPFTRTYPGTFDANSDGIPDEVNKAYVKALLQPLRDFQRERQAPVAVNEFGVARWQPGADRYLKDIFDILNEWGVSSSLWEWQSDFPGVDWDDFNFRRGSDPENHEDVSGSALERQIRAAWEKNRVRPNLVRGRW